MDGGGWREGGGKECIWLRMCKWRRERVDGSREDGGKVNRGRVDGGRVDGGGWREHRGWGVDGRGREWMERG